MPTAEQVEQHFEPIDAPPQTVGAPVPTKGTIVPNLRATIPYDLQLETDLADQQYTGSVPQIRTLPLQASANPQVNAAAINQTVIIQSSSPSGSSGVAGHEGSLSMPSSVFKVSGDSPLTESGGAIAVDLVAQPFGTFLASPALGSPASLDSVYTNSNVGAGASDTIDVPTANDIVIYGLQTANTAITAAPGSPWTKLSGGFSYTSLGLYYATFSDAGSQSISWNFSANAAWASAGVMFQSSGSPSVRQTKIINSAAGRGTYTGKFTSSVLAGSVILVFVASFATEGVSTNFSVSDSNNRGYSLLTSSPNFYPVPNAGDSPAQLQFWGVTNASADSPTVTISVNEYLSFSHATLFMCEISGLNDGNGTPYFRAITAGDLTNAVFGPAGATASAGAVPAPPTTAATDMYLREDGNWTQITLTTDVTGKLPIVNGGTGASSAATVAGTGITVSGTFPNQTVNSVEGGASSKSANYTAATADNGTVIVFTGSSALTLTLPSAIPQSKWHIWTQNNSSASLTVSPNGRDINGSSSSLTVAAGDGIYVTTDGTNYFAAI